MLHDIDTGRNGRAGKSRGIVDAANLARARTSEPLKFPPDAGGISTGACVELPGSTPITLMQLNEYTCKWPVGDGSPQLFCGCHVREGSPYCTSHARLGRGSGTPSEREIVARAMRISRSEGRSGFRGRQVGQSL